MSNLNKLSSTMMTFTVTDFKDINFTNILHWLYITSLTLVFYMKKLIPVSKSDKRPDLDSLICCVTWRFTPYLTVHGIVEMALFGL